jgi:hypothetical protein
LAKLAHHIGDSAEVVSNYGRNVFDQALHNGLARDWEKGLCGGQGMGAQTGSAAGHGNNNVHRWVERFGLVRQK